MTANRQAKAPAKGSAVDLTRRLKAINKWREGFNPTVGLTLSRARALVEDYGRGQFADLMWTFGAPFTGIECADPDLLALIERRTSKVLEMDWSIKIVPEGKRGPAFDEALATKQEAVLRAAYERIDNLYEAIEAMCMASFRGFAHAEKWRDARGVYHLEVVEPWNVVRDGFNGAWKYNPEASVASFGSLPEENLMRPERFVSRVVSRPINRFALVKFIRQNLSEKDWDAFIEIYGIPGGVVTMPPGVPIGKEAEYQEAAKQVAEGGSGAIPHGATYTANDGPRGNNPFRDRLDYLTEKLVLAGTGGLLTMLSMPTGIGSGASDNHDEAFTTIAKGEARKINEAFQRQIDAEILAANFPGQPVLAYFALGLEEETDAGQIVQDVVALNGAGYVVSAAQVREKTGYEVEGAQETEGTETPKVAAPLVNREKTPKLETQNSKLDVKAGLAADLEPVMKRVAALLKAGPSDPAAVQDLQKEIAAAHGADLEKTTAAMARVITSGVMRGMEQQQKERKDKKS